MDFTDGGIRMKEWCFTCTYFVPEDHNTKGHCTVCGDKRKVFNFHSCSDWKQKEDTIE